jgi:hypothetical protein
MRNSPRLPYLALLAAAILALVVWWTHDSGPLNELELGGVAWVVGLLIFGFQGLLSVLVEGEELHPGRVLPRLTDVLSVGIVFISAGLVATATVLAYGLTDNWRPEWIGVMAGGGCFEVALLLVFYKEGFLGDEATFDEREDGVPW